MYRILFSLIIASSFVFEAMGEVTKQEISFLSVNNQTPTVLENIKEKPVSISEDPVLKVEFKTLHQLLEQQRYNLNLFMTLIGLLIAIAGFFIYRQSGKIEALYTQYMQKLTNLHENDAQLAKHSQDIRTQRELLESLNIELELESKLFVAENTMSKVYQLINSVQSAISQYKSLCESETSTPDSDKCKSQLAYANDILTEMKDYCGSALAKLQFVQQNFWRLNENQKADMEIKLASSWVRAYVGSALIYKREWLLTPKNGLLQLAISELNLAIPKCSSLTSSIDKARVYYNLACYHALNSSLDEARKNLDTAIELNSRYQLSSKFDEDLKKLFN